jgi:hypothetical protein
VLPPALSWLTLRLRPIKECSGWLERPLLVAKAVAARLPCAGETALVREGGPGHDQCHGSHGREEKVAGVKLVFRRRPVVPGHHAAGQRAQHAEEQRPEDVQGLPPRVKQPGGAADQHADDREYEKVQHVFLPFTY